MKGHEIYRFMFAEGPVRELRQLISGFVWPYKGVLLLTTKCLSAALPSVFMVFIYVQNYNVKLTEHWGRDPIQTVTLVRCFLQLLILARAALSLILIRLRVRQQGLVILFIIVTKLYQK